MAGPTAHQADPFRPGARGSSAALTAAAIGGVAAFWLGWWWKVAIGEHALLGRDLTLFALPAKAHALDGLGELEAPLWLAEAGAGLPFLADLSNQALYPLNLLAAAAPDLASGLSWFQVAHVAIGMLGMFALGRALGLGRGCALWGAAMFGGSGYVISILFNVNYVAAVAWAPCGLAAWVAGGAHASARSTALLALALALTVLAGDVLDAGVLAGVCAAYALATAPRGAWPGLLIALVLAVTLAAALAAAQILPSYELYQHSIRRDGIDYSALAMWSFPPVRSLELVTPFLFGTRMPDYEFLAGDLYPARGTPWADSIYVGLIPLGFAAVGLALRAPTARLWALIGIGALLVAFGGNAPYHAWLIENVPLLGTQRFPEKLLFWTTLALCVGAALGAQAILARASTLGVAWGATRTWVRALAGILAAFAVVYGLAALPTEFWLTAHARTPSPLWSERLGIAVTHPGGLLIHAAMTAVLVALALWWPPARMTGAVVMLMLATILDLIWMHHPQTPSAPVALVSDHEPPDLARHLAGKGRVWFDTEVPGATFTVRDGRLMKRIEAALNGPAGDSKRQRALRDYVLIYASLLFRARLYPNHGITHGIRYLNGDWSPLRPWWHRDQERAALARDGIAYLQGASVRHVVTLIDPRNRRWDDERMTEVHRDPEINVRVLAVHDPRPYAWLARRPPSAGADAAARGASASGVVDLTLHAGNAGGGSVELIERRTGSIRLKVASPHGQAVVAITESWFPGWEATVDGAVKPPVRVDGRFLGVEIGPDAHAVEFAYRSRGFEAGAPISGAALLVALGAALVRPRRHAPAG